MIVKILSDNYFCLLNGVELEKIRHLGSLESGKSPLGGYGKAICHDFPRELRSGK